MHEPTLQTFTRADYTLEEYERAAERSEFKLEYYEGRIIMSSPSLNHGEIIGNITGPLRKIMRNAGWRIVGEAGEVRPRLVQGERTPVFRPDILIFPWAERIQGERLVPNPLALIEVLSPSTEDFDKEDKFERCGRIPELRHFVLIDQFRMEVEHRFRADAASGWQTEVLTQPEERLVFPETPFDLSLAQIYEDIPLAQ